MKKVIKNEKNAVKFLQTALKISKSILKSQDTELKNANFTIENNKILFKIAISEIDDDIKSNSEDEFSIKNAQNGKIEMPEGKILLENGVSNCEISYKKEKIGKKFKNIENSAKNYEDIDFTTKNVEKLQNNLLNNENVEDVAKFENIEQISDEKGDINDRIEQKSALKVQILSEKGIKSVKKATNENKNDYFRKSKNLTTQNKSEDANSNSQNQIYSDDALEFPHNDHTSSLEINSVAVDFADKYGENPSFIPSLGEQTYAPEYSNNSQNQDVAFDELELEQDLKKQQDDLESQKIDKDIVEKNKEESDTSTNKMHILKPNKSGEKAISISGKTTDYSLSQDDENDAEQDGE